jgi:hypothetical protein
MNKHECRKAAQEAAQRISTANAKLRDAIEHLPMTAKLAAGKELTIALEAITAIGDLALVLNEEAKL